VAKTARDSRSVKNKMAKCRALKKLKEALPSTSSQRIAIIQHYLSSSQTAKQSVIKQRSPSLSDKVLENMRHFITQTKQKRSSGGYPKIIHKFLNFVRSHVKSCLPFRKFKARFFRPKNWSTNSLTIWEPSRLFLLGWRIMVFNATFNNISVFSYIVTVG
jgi:hypothetical protein